MSSSSNLRNICCPVRQVASSVQSFSLASTPRPSRTNWRASWNSLRSGRSSKSRHIAESARTAPLLGEATKSRQHAPRKCLKLSTLGGLPAADEYQPPSFEKSQATWLAASHPLFLLDHVDSVPDDVIVLYSLGVIQEQRQIGVEAQQSLQTDFRLVPAVAKIFRVSPHTASTFLTN